MSTLRTNVIAGLAAATVISGAGIGLHQYRQADDQLVRVIDGDTIVINKGEIVRLWGMDAPEIEQVCQRAVDVPTAVGASFGTSKWRCGEAAKVYLESFFKPQVRLKCERSGFSGMDKKDIYGRTIARCDVINLKGEKHDIGKSMVSAGYAVDYPRYSNRYYALDEHYARESKLGIWGGAFVPPMMFRKGVQK